MRRRAVHLVAAVLVVSCGEGDQPSPGLAERYDAVIAFCEERLNSTADLCDRVRESDKSSIVGHVLLGQAGGSTLMVQVEVSSGGRTTTETASQDEIPSDRSWMHGVEIQRDQACESLPCTITLSAIVDGELVLSDELVFVVPG